MKKSLGIFEPVKENLYFIPKPVKQLSDVLEIIEQFRQEQNPPYKEYENTYMDGWLDACNEIYFAIKEITE